MADTTSPKLFISYSWTTPGHEEWVLNLATQLVEAGVDVKLDKWHLREGHDAIQFMEQMVIDPEMKKVIMVCDRAYAEKADKRHGGVGTEAQIISPQLYAKADQNKFVAVIAEKDADGKPYVPTYYQSRIHIDLADSDLYATNLEKLIRWIYDKPTHVRPELGKRPAFLDAAESVSLGTSVKFNRVIDALRNDRGHAAAAASEYFDTVVDHLGRFVIKEATKENLDDLIIERIEQFLPHRNEMIEVFGVLAQYRDNAETRAMVHRFFERLIPYMNRPSGQDGTYFRDQYDNMKFVVHELFLYLIAILIRYEKFEFATHMVDQRYYLQRSGERRMESYAVFHEHGISFARMSEEKRRASFRADLLEQRSHASNLPFEQLMQGDLVLHTRGLREAVEGTGKCWWPESLLYSTFNHEGAMEIFVRAESERYFMRIAPMLGVHTKSDLEKIQAALANRDDLRARWSFHGVPWERLVNLTKIATRP